MEVVSAEVGLHLSDHATAELHRVEAEYKAAMARISRMQAEATISGSTRELDIAIKKAQDNVRILKGEKAEVALTADSSDLDEDIAAAEAKVKALDGKKARIEIELRGHAEAARGLEDIAKREAALAALEARNAKQRENIITNDKRLMRSRAVETEKEAIEVDKLTTAWIRQSKVVEKLHRQRPPLLGKEAQAEFAHFQREADNKLALIEGRLRSLGAKVPPLHMRVDDHFLARAKFAVQDFVNNAQKKLSSINKVRLNLGPFSGTIRTMIIALAGLGPIVTSTVGALTSLVGVLGTGLAGAAAIGGGALAGLAVNFLGVAAALHPMIADFKIAHAATQAYNKQVLLHGAGSKQAAKAQDQMNRSLAGVDPLAADAATRMGDLSREWAKLTRSATHQNAGMAMAAGFKTLHAILPTVAKNTNDTTAIVATSFAHMMASIRKNSGQKGGGILGSLGSSANTFLAPALRGAEHLGAALARIAESAARIFAGPAGNGFLKWAEHFDKSTQNSDKLDANIRRLGHHATDLLHFFGALGRLITTVFNGGADSGDHMVRSMTRALNRWNDFLKSPSGHEKMATFFDKAESGARALWSAIGPLIASFGKWSIMLEPFTSGLLKGIGYVAKLVGGLIKLGGMKQSLGALGVTLGLAFGISKIAGFLGMLIRVVKLMKEAAVLAKAGKIGEAFKSLGGIGGALRGKGAGIAGSIEGASKTGAAAMATAIEDASVVAARNMGAAITEGGAAAGAEQRTAIVEGGAVAAEEEAAGAAAGGGGAGLLGKLGGGRFLSRFIKGAGAVSVASLIGRHFLGAEGDPLAFLFNPSNAGGPGDTVSSSPSLKAAESALDKAFGGSKARKLAGDFEMSMDGMFKHQETKMKDVFGHKVPVDVVVNDAEAQARMHDTFTKLERTTKGKRFVATLAVQLKGNQLAQEQIAKLASTKLGSKLLMILSKGGPEAAKWLAHIADTKIGEKLVSIITRGGPDARKLVDALSNKKIRNKVFDIIQHGGPDVRRQLEHILGIKIPHKHFDIHAHDFTRPVLDGIKRAIAAVHGKTVTITTQWVNMGRQMGIAAGQFAAGHAGGGHADEWGGGSQELWKKQQRAMDIATARGPSQQRFGKFNRPTLLVGEEDRSEIVISTNPKYRKTNIRYLMDAARELGVNFVTSAAKGKGGQTHLAPGVRHMHYVRGAPTIPSARHTPTSQIYSDPFYHERGASPYEGVKGPGSVYGDIPPIIGDTLDSLSDTPGKMRAEFAGRFDVATIDKIKDRIEKLYTDQLAAVNRANQGVRDAKDKMRRGATEFNKAKTKSARHTASVHIGQGKEDLRYWYWYSDRARTGGSVMDRKGRHRLTFMPFTKVEDMKSDVELASKSLHTWYDNRDHLSTEARNFESKADNSRTLYEQNGNEVDLDAWHRYMDKAKRDWDKVKTLDDEAIDIAHGLQNSMPNPKALQGLLDSLTTDEIDADTGSIRVGGAVEPGFAGPKGGQLDLNTWLTQHGVFDDSAYTTLAQERTALDTQFAQTGIGDDPAHPDTYEDNVRAADRIQAFWQGVYDRLSSDPTMKDSGLLGEAATALTSAQQSYKDVYSAAHPAADLSTSMGLQVSAANTERGNVLAQYGSNIQGLSGLNPLSDPAGRGMGWAEMNAAMLAPDYGRIGGGSGMSTRFAGNSLGSGGGSVHVTNNFGAPPPDPHTWSQGVKFEIGAII